MFDLNVSSPDDGRQLDGALGSATVDDPATSNSSVLNAEGSSNPADEESCSSRSAGKPFQFGILKDRGDVDTEEVEEVGCFVDEEVNNNSFVVESSQSQYVTRQLFPPAAAPLVKGGNGYGLRAVGMVPQIAPSSSSEPHPLGFSFRQSGVAGQQQQQVKKSRRGPRSRSSQYRGVTFYRRTGRWESHIWDCGKQVYLGGFDTAHAAARAYDRAAIKFRGVDADINFNLNDYDEDLKQLRNLTKEEFVHVLRRQSTGFSRGGSKYRGVALHKCGSWEARMGQFLGKKAYDKAAIQCNGTEAVTNFEPTIYEGEIASKMNYEASGQNLDLDLRISQPIILGEKHHGGTAGIHNQRSFLEAADSNKSGEGPTLLVSRAHGIAVGRSENPAVYGALYPGYIGNAKEQAAGMRTEIPLALPNWAPLALFPSAASSGFSASTMSPTVPHPAQSSSAIYHRRFRPSNNPHLYLN